MRLKSLTVFVLFINSFIVSADCYIDVKSFKESCAHNTQDTFIIWCPHNEYPDGRTPVPSVIPKIACAGAMYDENYPIYACPLAQDMRSQCTNDLPPKITEQTFPDQPLNACGSVINIDNQSVSEEINLRGVPFKLYYSSDRVKGRKDLHQATVPLTRENYITPTGVNGISGSVYVAGQSMNASYVPAQNLSHTFVWDGKDNLGNDVSGSIEAIAVAAPQYSTPRCTVPVQSAGTWFWINSNPTWVSCSFSVADNVTSKTILGSIFTKIGGIGGWEFDVIHKFDPVRKILYLGDGSNYNSSYLTRPNGDKWFVSKDRKEIYVFTNDLHVSTKDALTNQTLLSFSYNSNKKLTSITDKYGNITSVQYSGSSPISITSQYGQVTTLSFDSNGYLSAVTDPTSTETYEMSYSNDGLLLTYEMPDGVMATFVYDSTGRLQTDISSAGPSVALNYSGNDNNKVFTKTSNLGRVESYTSSYNQTNYTRYGTFPNGAQSNYSEQIIHKDFTSSGSGRPGLNVSFTEDINRFLGTKRISNVSINDGGISSSTSYNESVSLSNTSDPFSFSTLLNSWTRGSKTSQTIYTASNKTFVETSPAKRVTTTMLNTLGDVDTVQFASLNPIELNYDSNGRITSVVNGSRTTSLRYNSDGEIDEVENSLNQITSYNYDSKGRLASQTLPDSRVIGFAYDSNDNLVNVTPPGRPTHNLNHNDMGYLESYIPPTIAAPSLNTTSYSYSNDRELLSVQRPNGDSIIFNYGTNGNLNSLSLPNGTRSLGYSSGVLNTVNSEDGHALYPTFSGTKPTYIYASSFAGMSYSYMQSFNADHLKSNESLYLGPASISVNYSYDGDGLITSAGSETFTRNTTTGFLTKITQGNIERNYAYSSGYGELSSLDAKYNTSNLYSQSFTRDSLGRILTMTHQYGSSSADVYSYIYDSTGRLTDVTLNGNPYSEYNYDSNSNRTSQTINGITSTATYDDQDTILTFGTKTFAKNLNGEITSVTDSATSQTVNLSYDVFGNLKQVVLPSKTINYKVDGYSRRVAKYNGSTLVEQYVWNPDNQLIAVTDSSNNVIQTFVYGSHMHSPDYMVAGGVTYQIVTNHLGSPVVVVNTASGNVSQEIVYDEFGKVLSDSNPGFQPFGFAGCLFDQDTKLCKFGAREYDPSVGRWLSKDAILFDGGDSNLYGYVMQDPVNFIDPTGEVLIAPIIGGALLGGGFDLATQLIQNGGNFNNVSWTSVAKSAAIGGALGGFGRLLGPFTTRGLPGGIQRARKYIRFDRPHHGKGYGFDGMIGKHLNTPAKLSPLLGLDGDDRNVCE